MRDILEIIRDRRSARVPFDRARRVPDRDLRRILEAARWSPTPHNMQNFEVVVVDDPWLMGALGRIETRISPVFIRENYAQLSFSEEELARKKTGILGATFPPAWTSPAAQHGEVVGDEVVGSLADSLRGAPTLLVVVYDPRKRAPASEGDVLGMMGLGCVMQSMWLAAEERGIGMQILSVFGGGGRVEDEIKRVLAVPAELKIAYAARLGYPAEAAEPHPRVRRDVEDFTHHGTWGTKSAR
jgi:nitroreductase